MSHNAIFALTVGGGIGFIFAAFGAVIWVLTHQQAQPVKTDEQKKPNS